jgi:hypothetical protein
VHARIGTLDVYMLAAMIWGVAIYLRGRSVLAGVTLGVGACMKLMAPYALVVLALVELLRWVLAARGGSAGWTPRRAMMRLAACAATAAGVFLVLLDILDRIAPPYNPATHKLVAGGPLGHLGHMLSYAANLTSPHGPKGIASYPWQWLADYKPIVYLYIDPAHPAAGLHHIHPAAHFLGLVSPPILLLAVPALAVAAWSIVRSRRDKAVASGGPGAAIELASVARDTSGMAIVSLAWFLGTFGPLELLSLLLSRTSYLYYMVIVMPGIYTAVVYLIDRRPPSRWLVFTWTVCVLVAAIVMYPFSPLP